jgi:hypothetical protein
MNTYYCHDNRHRNFTPVMVMPNGQIIWQQLESCATFDIPVRSATPTAQTRGKKKPAVQPVSQ